MIPGLPERVERDVRRSYLENVLEVLNDAAACTLTLTSGNDSQHKDIGVHAKEPGSLCLM